MSPGVRLGKAKQWRRVDGVLLFDKPSGPSSNQALQRVRHLFGAAKAGHTGSLDPIATGLLPICFGEATKIAGYLLGSAKAYEAECRLGVVTDSADCAGTVTSTRPVAAYTPGDFEAALAPLRGRIRQVPPVYSALKRGGEPLYRLARRGEAVEVEAREVEVSRLELIEQSGERVRLHVECGSGTYVRSLVRDFGENLGCGAHVTALRRLWVEPFRTPAMVALERIEAMAGADPSALYALLLPVDAALAGFPEIILDADDSRRLAHGQVLEMAGKSVVYRVRSDRGQLLALARLDDDGRLRILRGFNPA